VPSYIDLCIENDSQDRAKKEMGSTTTNGAYLWSSVMKLSRDLKTFQVMTSTLFPGTCGFVASLVATKLYQQNPNRK
jgi:hypothetical protein